MVSKAIINNVLTKKKNKKFREELIRLLSLHKSLIWSIWT
jgi:hypothetical protein